MRSKFNGSTCKCMKNNYLAISLYRKFLNPLYSTLFLGINQAHLEHYYYTDIITFDYTEDEVISGDLYISIDRVLDNAGLLNEPADVELRRVCVHGILHLCGYKDKNSEEEAKMRSRENFHLDKYVSRET